MKQFLGILSFAILFSGLSSCSRNSIQKPDQLIDREMFVKMLTDMYIIQGITEEVTMTDSIKKSITQTDLYYSVLKKYSVADTVFIRSLMYYSSFPKNYEKMHVEIMNTLNQSDEQFKPVEDKLQLKKE